MLTSKTHKTTASSDNMSQDEAAGNFFEKKIIKKIRNMVLYLVNYIDTVDIDLYPLHTFVSIWRIIQYIGPSLAACYPNFWKPNSYYSKAISIISIFFHIIPPPYRAQSSIIVEFAYFGIVLLSTILILGTAFNFRKNAKVSEWIPYFFVSFVDGISLLITPIVCQIIGESIGRLIKGSTHFSEALEIIGIIFGFIGLVTQMFFFIRFNSVSVVFRPFSLMTVLHEPQIHFTSMSLLITFLTAIASQLNQVPRVILTFITSLLYIVCILIVFYPGSIISYVYRKLLFSASLSCFIFMLIVGIYDLIGHEAVMIELFVYILVFIVSYIVSVFVGGRSIMKKLRFIDEKGDDINNYTSVWHFLNMSICAFERSHPILNDWQLFKSAAFKYEDSMDFWMVFAKFVAIYPEENSLLSYIIFSIQSQHFSSLVARQAVSQAKIVLTQREGSLTSELKIRLTKSARQVQFAKRKLRHVWDLAIQSNTREMDSAINSANISVTKARSNFLHIFGQYPNNRFVAKAYARFILEVDGDQQKFFEWNEKIQILNRGILVHPDRTNLLGLHAYPILPIITQYGMSPTKGSAQYDLDHTVSESSTITVEDLQGIQMNEQISVIQDRIRVLSIPATNFIIAWTTILYFIMVLVPAIFLLVYTPTYFDEMTTPINFMYHLSFMRSAAFMLPAFGHHYLCEQLNISENESFFSKPNYKFHMESFGGANETREQFKHVASMNSNSIEQVGMYRSWSPNDERISIVHEIVFGNSIPYRYYSNSSNGETSFTANVSLQTAMMESAMQITNLLEIEETGGTLTFDLFSTANLANPIYNARTIVEYVEIALQNLYGYLAQRHDDIDNVTLFAMLFLAICYSVTIAGLLIYQIKNLTNANKIVYECLTALPKNVVSNVAESMRMIAKEEDGQISDEETDNFNKQDENIMKVFSSASDISLMKSREKIHYITLNVLFIICVVVIIVLICKVFPTISREVEINSPHLDYILGAVSHMFGGVACMNYMVTSLYNYPNALLSWQELANSSLLRMNLFNTYFHRVQYGMEETSSPPFAGYSKTYWEAMPYFQCEDDKRVPERFNETFSCFSIDVKLHLIEPFVLSQILPVLEDPEEFNISHSSEYLENLWLLSIELYDKLFFPMFDEIVSNTKSLLLSEIPRYRTPTIILLVVLLVIVIGIYYEAHLSSNKIKFALSILLQCPPNVVMQTAKVMNVLSGDFEEKVHDMGTHQAEYFDLVVQRIPDSVIIMDSDYNIISVNRSSERIYKISSEDFVGQNGQDFFFSSQFSENASEIFENLDTLIDVEYYIDEGESDCSYLRIKLSFFQNSYVVTARDITQTMLYKRLISDEKEKSDRLLAAILPPNLIRRVQDGEQNISFSVQSATVLFLDIVSFTPWCAANTAQMIMSTLNIMFRELDSRLMRHSTLTKIKCIGDCYMAAGGIFVEVNQPAVHAKEMVEFGLEALQALVYINKEYNLTLQIRVGINTGGPLVAGVFGTEKPTFEILGPAINMAQQMEHHGVAMMVHISRSTYELVYGGNFIIKERGKIEVKNGKVSTYLVSGKNS